MPESRCWYKQYTHTPSETAKRLWFYVHTVGWYRCDGDFQIWRKSLHDSLLMYVIHGKGYVTQNSQSHAVKAGDVVFMDLSGPHGLRADERDPWDILWVHFGGLQSGEYHRMLDTMVNPVLASHPSDLMRLFQTLFNLFATNQRAVEPKAASMVTRILTELVASRLNDGSVTEELGQANYPESIRQSIQYIENNYEKPLSLDEIAQQAPLSAFHFARLFKRTTGRSVLDYLVRVRLDQAKTLLLETDLSIREIGERVGFTDHSYFTKVFKRYENVTPTEYRMAKRENYPGAPPR